MRYLLDTNVYYKWRIEPDELGAAAFELLTNGGHEFLISTITPWELAIKAKTGKLATGSLLLDFEARETRAGFTMTPITTLQVIASGMLPLHHKDPFDRLLIAQSLDLGAPVLSSDSTFDLYGVQRIWA
jgi:PIN domain nuclease of toxin-antitoxin system